MLAKEKGLRQSITLHHCTPNNEMFTQLPSARSAGGKAKKQRGGPCTVCATISYEDYGDEVSIQHPALWVMSYFGTHQGPFRLSFS